MKIKTGEETNVLSHDGSQTSESWENMIECLTIRSNPFGNQAEVPDAKKNNKKITLVGKDCFNFNNLKDILNAMYSDLSTGSNSPNISKEKNPELKIKYRDNELDLITLDSDRDLKEALKFTVNKHDKNVKTNKDTHIKQKNTETLHLFMVSNGNNNNNPSLERGGSLTLHGITSLMMKLNVDDNGMDIADEANDVLESCLLIKGSGWQGTCFYVSSGEVFSFRLLVTDRYPGTDKQKVKTKKSIRKDIVEGRIEWMEPISAVTMFLGTISGYMFKFREYEAVLGQENVELPSDYRGVIDLSSSSISGTILTKDKPTFSLEFVGVDTLKDGFIATRPHVGPTANPKRKYNLCVNSSIDQPTLEGQRMAFKKLVYNSPRWYDPFQQVQLEARPKDEVKKQGRSKSCKKCGMPLMEQLDLEGKKIMACSSYPTCFAPEDWDYDSDDCDEDDDC